MWCFLRLGDLADRIWRGTQIYRDTTAYWGGGSFINKPLPVQRQEILILVAWDLDWPLDMKSLLPVLRIVQIVVSAIIAVIGLLVLSLSAHLSAVSLADTDKNGYRVREIPLTRRRRQFAD